MKTTPYELVFGQPPRSSAFPGLSNHQRIMEEDVQDLLEERERDEDYLQEESELGCNGDRQWEELEQNHELDEGREDLEQEYDDQEFAEDFEYLHSIQADQWEEENNDQEIAEDGNEQDEDDFDIRQADHGQSKELELRENEDMKEFVKDDNERDEDEEETNSDSSARPQLATTHKHIRIREEADKLYLRNAERMRMKYTKCKRKKVLTFSPGDIVSIRVPRIDRTSTDFHRIPCVVVERRGSKFFLYRLRYMQTLFYLFGYCIFYLLYTDVLMVY